MSTDWTRRTAAELVDAPGRRRRHQRRADPGAPRPDRRRRPRRARLLAGRRRRRPGPGRRRRRAAPCGPPAEPPRRGADRGQGRARHPRAAHDVRLADPRGLGAAVRRHGGRPAARRRPAHPRQDQHGRVRDGLLDRALRLRTHPQPVGPRPDPRWLGRWLGRRGRGLRGPAGDRHRHRRLDPPARGRHRHGRREADVRRGLALRAGGPGQLARPGRPRHPHGARRRAAARGDRRARPARLHQHRPAAARRWWRPRSRAPPAT